MTTQATNLTVTPGAQTQQFINLMQQLQGVRDAFIEIQTAHTTDADAETAEVERITAAFETAYCCIESETKKAFAQDVFDALS